MPQGPGRLSAHRMALALALVSAGPPLVVHDGWRGLIVAVAGAAYAVYLLVGKRWPRPLRRRRRPATGRAPRAVAPRAAAPRAGQDPSESRG